MLLAPKQRITFLVPGELAVRNGTVIDPDIDTASGEPLLPEERPCAFVLSTDDQQWAVPYGWIIQ